MHVVGRQEVFMGTLAPEVEEHDPRKRAGRGRGSSYVLPFLPGSWRKGPRQTTSAPFITHP